jgi:hypothetical protein
MAIKDSPLSRDYILFIRFFMIREYITVFNTNLLTLENYKSCLNALQLENTIHVNLVDITSHEKFSEYFSIPRSCNPDDAYRAFYAEYYPSVRNVMDAEFEDAETAQESNTTQPEGFKIDNTIYEALGLSRDADTATIQRARKILARKYHPDKFHVIIENEYDSLKEPKISRDEYRKQQQQRILDTTEKFKHINDMLEVLSTPTLREINDKYGSQEALRALSIKKANG